MPGIFKPGSVVDSSSSNNLNIETFSSTDTLDLNNSLALCNTSGGAFTLNLPSAANSQYKHYWIQYTDTGFANALTVDPNSSDTIGGSSTTTLNTKGETIEIVSDGVSDWKIIRRDIPVIYTAYTPTITHDSGSITSATITGLWYRKRDKLCCRGEIDFTTVGTFSGIYVSLPGSLTVDEAKLFTGATNTQNVGFGSVIDTGTSNTAAWVRYIDNASTTVNVQYLNAPASTTIATISQTSPYTLTSADFIYWNFEVPITGWNG